MNNNLWMRRMCSCVAWRRFPESFRISVNNEWAWDGRAGKREHYFKGHSENMTRGTQTFRVVWPKNLGDRSLLYKLSLEAGSEGMSETMNLDAFKLKAPFLMLIAFWQKTRLCFRWPLAAIKNSISFRGFCDENIFIFHFFTSSLIKKSLRFCDQFRSPGNCHVCLSGSCFRNQKIKFPQSLFVICLAAITDIGTCLRNCQTSIGDVRNNRRK